MLPLLAIALAAEPTPLQEHMQGHFANATDAMWLAAIGDLEGARREAAALDHPPTTELPPELKQLAQGLSERAAALAKVEDLKSAAEGAAGLTTQCAACHQAATNGPKVDQDGVKRMGNAGPSHLWGVYGMWVGLVLPDDRAWIEGVGLMAPAKVSEHLKAASVAERATELAKRVEAASNAVTHADRTRAFAAVIQTCADCHKALELPI